MSLIFINVCSLCCSLALVYALADTTSAAFHSLSSYSLVSVFFNSTRHQSRVFFSLNWIREFPIAAFSALDCCENDALNFVIAVAVVGMSFVFDRKLPDCAWWVPLASEICFISFDHICKRIVQLYTIRSFVIGNSFSQCNESKKQ